MELRQLEYFLAVAEAGSVSKAARQLYIAQPALSRQIQKLEEELDAPLFDRTSSGMRLTPIGEIFLAAVQRGFAQFEAGRQAVRDHLGPDHGTVRLGFLPALGGHLLPEVLAAFRRRYPHVVLVLRQRTTGPVLQMLETAEIDLGIVTAPPRGSIETLHLEAAPLLRQELLVALPPEHPLAARETLDLHDLAGEPFVMVRQGSGLRSLIEAACHAAGFAPVVGVEGEDLATISGLVAAGLGISLLPPLALHEQRPLHPAVRQLAQQLHWPIDVIWHRDRYMPAAVRAFRDMLLVRAEPAPPVPPS